MKTSDLPARATHRRDTFSGIYVVHCHILDYEDMGMMRNLMVGNGMGM